jgi:hypothetical protein
MPDPLNDLSRLGFSNNWMKTSSKKRYSRSAHRLEKSLRALQSKSAAKNTYKGTFRYLADFFRYASDVELVEVYEKLKRREGFYIDNAIAINAEEHPEIRTAPRSFFTAFEKFDRQIESAGKRAVEKYNKGNMNLSPKRMSARRILYVHIMKYEDVQPSYFINVLFRVIPTSYIKTSVSNISPMTRKNRTA